MKKLPDDTTKELPATALFRSLRKLEPAEVEAPSLPPEMLPGVMREWVADVAERMQVPLEMVAVPALGALSSIVGRRIGIHPNAQNDWLVIPNLWGMVVARPGRMKSPAMAEALSPLHALEDEARKRAELERQSELEELSLKESEIQQQLKENVDLGESEAIEAKLQRVRRELKEKEREAIQAPRYVVNDATVEKLAELLRDNPAGLLLARDELAGWLQGLTRSDRKGDREFYLESWDGKSPWRVDRIGRGSTYVRAMCLALIGGIQPEKLSAVLMEALDHGRSADGLIQRFQLLVWPQNRSDWRLVDRQPNNEARRQVFEVFRILSELPLADDQETPALRFTEEAQTAFNSWREELEQRLLSRELELSPAFESHLSKYRSLVPSLALLFHLVTCDLSTEIPPVSLNAVQLAIGWCKFLELHARKLYFPELKRDLVAAHALAQKIQAGVIATGTTIRDVYTMGWSGLGRSQTVVDGMKILEEYGWVKIESPNRVGRPGKTIVLNPKLEASSSCVGDLLAPSLNPSQL